MPEWVLFDDGLESLAPLTDLRASFELRTGALTSFDRWTVRMGSPPIALLVPDQISALIASRHAMPVNALPSQEHSKKESPDLFFVNGRFSQASGDLPLKPDSAVIDANGALIIARLDPKRSQEAVESRNPASVLDLSNAERSSVSMIAQPWDILRHVVENLPMDMTMMSFPQYKPLRQDESRMIMIEGHHPVFVGKKINLQPHVVFDTSRGSVILDEGVTIRSMSVLGGPCYIGAGSTISAQSDIRPGTVIGPQCKVGGEVSASLFQGYSNKSHTGFLGDSFVGEWVNLGAGTITSNLKNTYGQVRVSKGSGRAQETGRQFLGSIIGDHVKTAIGTRLQAGSFLGTGSSIAVSDLAPKTITPFTFITDDGIETYDLARFLEVAKTVMARRDVELSSTMRDRLADLHARSTSPAISAHSSNECHL